MAYKNLTARYVKRLNDFIYYFPRKCDGHLIHNWLTLTRFDGKTLIEELENRGYDTKTLVFHCKRKPEAQ